VGVVLAVVASGCGDDVPRAQSLTEALRAFEAVHRHWAEEASKPPPKPPEPPWTEQDDALPDTLEGQREEILRKLRERMGVSEEAIVKLREAFGTYRSGQGNPKVTKHPMTRAECRAIRAKAETFPASEVCGEKNMVALYNPSKGETEKDAKVCIDQFEFPNIACEYPMTWVQAQQTQKICKAMGKRLCDAHEWEGGCYGELWPPEEEYAFTLDRENMSGLHNFNNKKNGWIRGEEGSQAVRDDEPQVGKMRGERVGAVRVEHVPGGGVPEVCESSWGVRPARQRGGAHEPADEAGAAWEPWGHRADGDEGQLVHLRFLRGAHRRLPVACPGLARQRGDAPQQPRELSPGISLLQGRGGRRDRGPGGGRQVKMPVCVAGPRCVR
jgi:hypothetical protein